MKKQTTTKIILGLIIFVFVVSIFQFALPIQAATDTSMANLYSNPNQSGNSTYKFKISDVVSSGLLTNVVGCTGIVNKVSTWMTKFIQSPAQTAKKEAESLKNFVDLLKKSCSAVKAGSETAGQSIPLIGGLAIPINTIMSNISLIPGGSGLGGPTTLAPGPATPSVSTKVKACQDQVDATDTETLKELQKQTEQEAAANLKTQCFDGIAITLAKNQLTAMTRSMMNWVNSGYGGNPFFVQNMRDFTNNIERNVLETGTDILLDKAFGGKNKSPYADDFARSAITSRGLASSSSNFLGTLQSDLGSFITDPKSYYTNGQLDQAMDTRDALERARDANYAFQNDFSVGGWDAYLALTQRDQNNPLGFTMLASQYLADTQAQQVSDARDELAQNNGFLSQKTCDEWQVYNEDGTSKSVGDGSLGPLPVFQNTPPKTCYKTSGECCSHWKTITPGSIIKEKTTNYLNSPERQLELAKTINDSLNALFSVLISKLQGGGLAGLSDSATDAPMNWTDNLNEFTSPDGNTPYDNNGAYDGFNLTRDLGNTYIHATPTPRSLGTWNAKICLPGQENQNNCNITSPSGKKLYPDLAPEVLANENPNNTYYTVKTPGSTKLLLEGYNGWEVGDRAFWDGKEWQNWKQGQTNPIEKRGVIQIQQDYIVAGKEILGVLPSIMPNLGKLDYCIPGPNPSYKTNSADAQSAYQDWVGSMYVGAYDNTGSRYGVRIDGAGERTYDNLQNIYADNSQVWSSIKTDVKPLFNMPYLISNFSNICNNKNRDCKGGYFYEGGDLTKSENDNLADKTSLMNKILDYVNNKMFQDFYTTFDKAMNKLYFNNMVNKYNDTETSIGLPGTENSDYIPMSVSGLDLTKNILYYNDDITKAVQDYTDAMAQAKINIAKLEPIKTEVSGIIKKAQDRRNEDLVAKLGLSLDKIKTKYATCFAEENMNFYDADTITNGGTTENCTDGIDNDLNGLIDMADPACNTNVNNTGTATTFYYKLMSCEDKQTDPNDPYLTGSYQTYTTGPYPSGTYSSGDRVQGETNSFYVVVGGATYTDPISGITNIGTTSTGESSCPQQ